MKKNFKLDVWITKLIRTVGDLTKSGILKIAYNKNELNEKILKEAVQPSVFKDYIVPRVLVVLRYLSFNYVHKLGSVYVSEYPTVRERIAQNLNRLIRREIFTSAASVFGGFLRITIEQLNDRYLKSRNRITDYDESKIPNKSDERRTFILDPLYSLLTSSRTIYLSAIRFSTNVIYVPVTIAKLLATMDPLFIRKFDAFLINLGQLITLRLKDRNAKSAKPEFDADPAFQSSWGSSNIHIDKSTSSLRFMFQVYSYITGIVYSPIDSDSYNNDQSYNDLRGKASSTSHSTSNPMEFNSSCSSNGKSMVNSLGDLGINSIRQYLYLFYIVQFFLEVMVPELKSMGWTIDLANGSMYHSLTGTTFDIKSLTYLIHKINFLNDKVSDELDVIKWIRILQSDESIQKIKVTRYDVSVIYYKGVSKFLTKDQEYIKKMQEISNRLTKIVLKDYKPNLYIKWLNLSQLILLHNFYQLNNYIFREFREDFHLVGDKYILYEFAYNERNIIIEFEKDKTVITFIKVLKNKINYIKYSRIILTKCDGSIRKEYFRYSSSKKILNEINELDYKMSKLSDMYITNLIKKLGKNSLIKRISTEGLGLPSKLKSSNEISLNPYFDDSIVTKNGRKVHYKYLEFEENKISIYNSRKDSIEIIDKSYNSLVTNLLSLNKSLKNQLILLNIPESENHNKHSEIHLIYIELLKAFLRNKNIKEIKRIKLIGDSANTPIIEFTLYLLDRSVSMRIINFNYLLDLYPKDMDRDITSILNYFKKKWGIDVLKNGIRPSQLAFSIFKKYYYDPKKPIYNLPDNLSDEIRNSYTTRPTDVFYQHIKEGYHYDVNSLYPYSMLKDYPYDKFLYIELEEPISNSSLFGYYYVEVSAPEKNIKFPILNVRSNIMTKAYNDLLNNKDDKSMIISPVGKWEGWYFSEEIHQAIRIGYKVKIKKILYYRKRSKLFYEYIMSYYNLKKEATDPIQRKTAKLLLNSLYGKFAQVIKTKYFKVENNNNNELILNNDNESIKEDLENNVERLKMENGPLYQIASMITSYSRITMSEIIERENKLGNKIAYVDIDSIITEKPISDKYISDNEIGYLKLVSHFRDGYILKPKIYSYIDINKNEEITTVHYSHSDFNHSKIKEIVLNNIYNKQAEVNIAQTKPIFKDGFPINVKYNRKKLMYEYHSQSRILGGHILARTKPLRIP